MPNREEKRKDYFIERFLEQTISISFYIVMDKQKDSEFYKSEELWKSGFQQHKCHKGNAHDAWTWFN